VFVLVLVAEDLFWFSQLAYGVLTRLVDRFGPDIKIVHDDATDIDESFAMMAKGLGVAVEARAADWHRLG
jgi:hypothetical protein